MSSSLRTIEAAFIDGQRPARNYITNGNFTDNAAGFVTYKDAAGNIPVDGTGGTPTLVTITRSTTSPLTGDASLEFFKNIGNAQGEGMSYDFSIDLADRASVLEISGVVNMASSPNSPGYQFGTGVYSSVIVYIYDVTNARLIEPQGMKLDVPPFQAPATQFRATFQTASNSSSYRLIFHVTDTSATSGYLINFDRLYVGRQQQASGAAITDAVIYTPTLSNSGTTGTNAAYWRRIGDSIAIQGRVVFTGAGPAANFRVRIPTGLTVDTAKVPATTSAALGNFLAQIGGVIANGTVNLTSVANEVIFIPDGGGGPYNGNSFGNGNELNYTFTVPVTGWSSNVSMSSETDTRVVAAILRRGASSQTMSGASDVKLAFNVAISDSHGAFSTSLNRYAVPVSGTYTSNAFLFFGTTATSVTLPIYVYKNGTYLRQIGIVTTSTTLNTTAQVSFLDTANAGDFYELFLNPQSQTVNLISDATIIGGSQWNINRLSGPAVVAATETVAFKANTTATTAIGAEANYLPATTVFDSHAAYNSATGYTIPVSGLYRFKAQAIIQSAINNLFVVRIQQDGTTVANGTTIITPISAAYTVATDTIIRCVAGQVIRARVLSTAGSATLDGIAASNFFEGFRIGN